MIRGRRSSAWLALPLGALLAAGCGGAGKAEMAGTPAGVLRISPERPFATNALLANLEGGTHEMPGARWEWRRNGARVAGAEGPTLPAAELRHGDRIAVAVTLPDGRQLTSPEVVIANSPPRIGRVNVVNAEGGLAAVVDATDPDGDATRFSYQWFRNGKAVSGAREPHFAPAGAAFGDQVSVEVVATDGSDASAPVRADAAALDNRAPQFSSSPVAPQKGAEHYRYQLSAVDADGDRVTFSLVRGPEGMTVSTNGAIDWRLPPLENRRGEYEVVVRATDEKGASVEQAFQLRVDAAPRAK